MKKPQKSRKNVLDGNEIHERIVRQQEEFMDMICPY